MARKAANAAYRWMPPDIDRDIPGRSVGNAAIITMQLPHTPTSATTAGGIPRRDISTANRAAPTASSVNEAASSHPYGWNAYSLIIPQSGSRSDITCSVTMAATPPARAANPPTVNRLVMHLTVAAGGVSGHPEIGRIEPWRVPEPTPTSPGSSPGTGQG
nr:hypothetical protein [Sphaerisporangium fuscum]